MTRSIEFHISGLPAAQGSKRHVGNGVMVESSKAVKPWRQDVSAAALDAIAQQAHWEPFSGPVQVRVEFNFTRPKSHFRSGKYQHQLKVNPPIWVTRKPDIEKLVRSTHDALTNAGIWRDDSLAVDIKATKRYASANGAFITITEITL